MCGLSSLVQKRNMKSGRNRGRVKGLTPKEGGERTHRHPQLDIASGRTKEKKESLLLRGERE